MGHRAGPAALHRQARLGAVERLDLALFVHAQHDRFVRGVEVEADDIDQLLFEAAVVRELEGVDPVGLKPAGPTRSAARWPGSPLGLWPSSGSSNASRQAALSAASRRRSHRSSPFGIDGLRPRPSATTPKFASRSRPKRARHAVTVAGDTPTSAAIAVFAMPSAAANNALARITSPWVAV